MVCSKSFAGFAETSNQGLTHHCHYNGRMIALRYLYVLALVVWLGGMVVVGGIVAPATFEVLQEREPVSGRVLAGAVFTEVFGRFHLAGYVAGATLLGTLALRALVGPRPPAFGVRMAIVAAMLGLMLYSGVFLSGQIEALAREVGRPVASLRQHDPRRVRFGRLHALSTALMFVQIAAGLALVYWETRE